MLGFGVGYTTNSSLVQMNLDFLQLNLFTSFKVFFNFQLIAVVSTNLRTREMKYLYLIQPMTVIQKSSNYYIDHPSDHDIVNGPVDGNEVNLSYHT